MAHPLDVLFKPKSIAIVGASQRSDSIGRMLIRNLLQSEYQGVIFPVNPKAPVINSLKAYPSVLDIPDPVDLAIITVPKDRVLDVVAECGEKGIRGLVVITAGFKEIGGEGVRREEELMAMVKKFGMRLIGPNCMGIFNTEPEVRMHATFAPTNPTRGKIAFISQSGALGAVVLELARTLNLGLSMFASVGNKPDVSGNDLIDYWNADPNTKLILMYLESFGNPRRFFQLARNITPTKPIIVVKAGKTAEGARAATSHTGAMTTTDFAINALLDQCGVLRVSSINEMFELAMAFAYQPLLRGNRVAVLTNAGGPGILVTDALIAGGLSLAELSHNAIRQLKAKLPEEASLHNPVDMIATATHESYRTALEILLDEPNVDAVVVIFVTPIMVTSKEIAHSIIEVLGTHQNKPVLTCLMGHQGVISGIKEMERRKLPVYAFPESAARVLSKMNAYRLWCEKTHGAIQSFTADRKRVSATIDHARKAGRPHLSSSEVQVILEAYGFPFVQSKLTRNVDEILAFAAGINGPIVVKIASDSIIHKSDIGAVKIDLRSPEEIKRSVSEIREAVRVHAPDADIDGFLVQEMIKNGKEMVLGMSADPKVGPVLMLGLGGIYVEVLRDVSFAVAPITDVEAIEMIQRLRSYPLLRGVRGEKPIHQDSLVGLIQRLSQLVTDFPEIVELDINPLIVGTQPDAFKVADARMRLKD